MIDSGDDDADDRQIEDASASSGKSRRGPLIAAAVVLLLVLAGGAYAWLNQSRGHAAAAKPVDSEKAMIDVPAMVVSLHTSDGRPHLLKLHVILLAADTDKVPAVRTRLPLYIDELQPFLHELRPDDLNGSAAVFRVKEEMLSRAADAFGEGAVRDVLIQDLIQQ
ncbi:flagellar basal body-associated FliL family protein [Sphingomonas sp. M6A6_1c]